MRLRNSLMLVFLVLMVSSFRCSKSDESTLGFDGFRLTDFAGNFLGQIGSADNDWTLMNFNSLPPFAQNLLNSNDGIGLPVGVGSAATVSNIVAYPNPCNQTMAFTFKSTDSAKLKVVIVDEYSMVLASTALRFKGSQSIGISTADRTKFIDKKGVRLYYSFSTLSNPNFTAGYGDIKICSSANGTAGSANACF